MNRVISQIHANKEALCLPIFAHYDTGLVPASCREIGGAMLLDQTKVSGDLNDSGVYNRIVSKDSGTYVYSMYFAHQYDDIAVSRFGKRIGALPFNVIVFSYSSVTDGFPKQTLSLQSRSGDFDKIDRDTPFPEDFEEYVIEEFMTPWALALAVATKKGMAYV